MRRNLFCVLIAVVFACCFTGCSKDEMKTFVTHTAEPNGPDSNPCVTQEVVDMSGKELMNLPDGYNYEKIKTSFLEYINYYAWYNPSEWPQDGYELTYEIYRPKKKEGMKDIVHCIWIKCRMDDGDRWYECYALTNGKLANWTEKYHFYYTTVSRDTGENSIYLGKDTVTIPSVKKPDFIENEEKQHQKAEVSSILEAGVKDVYELLKDERYGEDLKIELVVSDFSIDKGLMPYSYLLINGNEVFECQFDVGIYKNKVYASYYNAFEVNYTIDWELSNRYSSGSVKVFDGNQIKPLDSMDKLTMERIRESAVFQYSYSERNGLTEDEVKALLKQDLHDAFLYELAVLEADESCTYALFVKNRSEKESVPNIISFDQSITGILLVAVENETGTLHYLFEGTAKDYLRQACLMRVDEEIYFLLNRQMNYIEWERFSLDTFVLDGSGMRQVYGSAEGDNLYDYWFSHKAKLCADGTIEISKRGDSLASYNEYIHTFSHTATDVLTYAVGSSWETEYKEGLYEFLSKQTWKERSGLSFESRSEVDILLQMRQCELFLNERIDITYSECSVLLKKDMGRFCLLVIKAKNDHHQAGFQNLIFTLYDKETSGFITAKGCYGDFSDAYLFEVNNEVYIAYYTQTVYTGMPTAGGGVFMLQEDDFVKIWPSEKDGSSVFAGRVAELTEDGRFLFSDVKWNLNESGMISYYDLIPGETVSVFDIIKSR